jgi:uncharacterized protein with PIN domain
MIIDTSALVALLDQEPEADRIARAIAAASDRMLCADYERARVPVLNPWTADAL